MFHRILPLVVLTLPVTLRADSGRFPPEVLAENLFPVVKFETSMGDDTLLDPSAKNRVYTVFGSVLEGRGALEAIAGVETGYNEGLDAGNVPPDPVLLVRARVQE